MAAIVCRALWLQLQPQLFRVWAQTARTIRVVVSVPAGGAIDALVRILADDIARTSGQTIIIDSRPGGGGVIAAEAVARAAPDGNTLLINTNGMLINAILRKVNFDPLTSFEPICKLVDVPAGAGRQQRLALPHARGPCRGGAREAGELSFASVGPHSTQHIAIERFKRLAGIDIIYVPYPGGAPAINALAGPARDRRAAELSGGQRATGCGSAARARGRIGAADRAVARAAHHRGIAAFRDLTPRCGSAWWHRRRRRRRRWRSSWAAFSRAVEAPEVKAKLAAAGALSGPAMRLRVCRPYPPPVRRLCAV